MRGAERGAWRNTAHPRIRQAATARASGIRIWRDGGSGGARGKGRKRITIRRRRRRRMMIIIMIIIIIVMIVIIIIMIKKVK